MTQYSIKSKKSRVNPLSTSPGSVVEIFQLFQIFLRRTFESGTQDLVQFPEKFSILELFFGWSACIFASPQPTVRKWKKETETGLKNEKIYPGWLEFEIWNTPRKKFKNSKKKESTSFLLFFIQVSSYFWIIHVICWIFCFFHFIFLIFRLWN